MSAVTPQDRKNRIRTLARAALKQALGVVTGDRRLQAEGAGEAASMGAASTGAAPIDPASIGPAVIGMAGPGRGGRSLAGRRDAR